jgi:hypothetical protein
MKLIRPENSTRLVGQFCHTLPLKNYGDWSSKKIACPSGQGGAYQSIKDRVSFGNNYLDAAIENDLIEISQPNAPKSPTQKYRLTKKGRNIVEPKSDPELRKPLILIR